MTSKVAIIGGGITGISAALEVARRGAEVHLFEAGDVLGGKIAEVELDGRVLPTAPDNFLARRTEMTELAISLGLEGELVSPAAGSPRIVRDATLYPLPPNVLGIPATAELAPGLLSAEGIARLKEDLGMGLSSPNAEESAGDLVRRRLGDEALEYLVDPLLGGINAGDSDQLSITSGVPQLLTLRDRAPSLIDAAAATLASRPANPGPVFQSVAGGLRRLVEAAETALRDNGAHVHLGSAAQLARDGDRWRVTNDDGTTDTSHVIVTTPARVTGLLIEPFSPDGAAALASISYSSVALTLLILPPGTIDVDASISGVLVPRNEGMHITAVSFASHKWPGLAPDGAQVLRVSTGRRNRTSWQELSDEELVNAIRSDLGQTFTTEIPAGPSHVTRWMNALPQYDVGHQDKVQKLDEAMTSLSGLVVTGAWRDGLGLPACVGAGRSAVSELFGH